jgi:hypothetical protein
MLRRSLVVGVGAALILAGCESVQPSEIAGKYALSSINGAGLPRDLTGGACRSGGPLCVLAGELWLVGDGTYVWWSLSNTPSPLLDAKGFYTQEGAWHNSGEDVVLTPPSGNRIQGRWSGSTVVIEPSATWTFER